MSSAETRAKYQRAFALVGLEHRLEHFTRAVLSAPTAFHNRFYRGDIPGSPGYGVFLPGLLDTYVAGLFRWGIGSYADCDFLATVNLRVDFAFTAADVQCSIELKFYPKLYYPTYWPVSGFELNP